MIPGMHHLMRQRVLEVGLAPDLIGADQDARVWVEAAALAVDLAVLGQPRGAAGAHDVGAVEPAVQRRDLLAQEDDCRRVLQREVAPLLALAAVPLLVGDVPRLAVVEGALGRYRPRQDLEVIHPPRRLRVEAGAFRVVLYEPGQIGGCCAGCGWLCLG